MKRTAFRLAALVALLLAVLLTLTSCGIFEVMQVLMENTPENYHAEVDFNTLTYERPDEEAIDAAMEKLRDVVAKNGSEADFLRAYFAASDALNGIRDQMTLADIYRNRDMTDEGWTEEYEYLSELDSEYTAEIFEIHDKVLNTKYESYLFGPLTDEEREKIHLESAAMDEEYLEIQGELTRITVAYDEASARYQSGGGEDVFIQEAGALYLEMIPLYRRLAEKFGYETVADYQYESVFGRSYYREDVIPLYELCKSKVAGLESTLAESLTQAEWDGYVEAYGKTADNTDAVIRTYLAELDGALGTVEIYDYMQRNHLWDRGAGDLRYSGAYTTYFSGMYFPYLFTTDMGGYQDALTFVHEFGHFTSSYHAGSTLDLDIAEVHSQGNEFLFMPYMEQMYGAAAARGVEKQSWFSALDTVAMGCLMDEFQALSFTGEYDTLEELQAEFLVLAKSYGYAEEDFEVSLSSLFLFIPHNFYYPFYYISYAVSVIPAMQLGALAKTDRAAAVEAYAAMILLDDGVTPFEELLEKAGLASPFTREAWDKIKEGVNALVGVK